MHLKRVDLVGFKSFANRTTLTFEPGITVLCGPNGSGKSNVSDAVRWALGEQSAKAIRGRKGEDVIFVGSQGRQPLGLAEVSLTLDNADGRIPLDYDEVRITRRYHRSGEAEYLANGAKVRLRDIHNWLLHAALDPHAYVVVGQGSVDELILQRAEERRAVLDNAADIRRHHARLSETRSRLATAEENLSRCRTVIGELEPHVRRLRSQAERAGRYRASHDELVTLAGRWFRAGIAAAEAELGVARHATATRRAEIAGIEEALAEIEASARSANAEARAVDEALQGEEQALARLHAEQSRLMREAAVAAERERAARESRSRQEAEREALGERLAGLQAEIVALDERLEVRRAELAAVQQAPQVGHDLEAAERRFRDLEQELAATRRRDGELEIESRLCERTVVDGAARRDALAGRVQQLSAEIGSAEAELVEAERRATSQAAEAQEQRGRADELRRELDEVAAGLGAARADLDQLRAERHRLAGERQRLEIARQALEQSAAAGSGVGLILESRLAGVLGLLGGELHVPRELRAAIGAALGESAQAVVVESAESATAGLGLVADQGADRVALIPVDSAAEAPPPELAQAFKSAARPLLADLPVHGFADELVGSEAKLDAVRARCLGLVVVVPDLAVARETASRLAADGVRAAPWQVVTVDGQAIRWNGEWRGGRDQGVERLVARQGERLELDRELRGLSTELTELEARLEERERSHADLLTRDRQAREQLAVAERDERVSAVAAETTSSRLPALRGALEAKRQTRHGAEEELRRVEGEIAQAAERQEGNTAERNDLARAMADLTGRVEAARSSWEEVRAVDAERRAGIAVLRSEVESQEQVLRRLRGEQAGLERARAELEARSRQDEERAGAERARLQELARARADVEAQIGPHEEGVAALRARRRAFSEDRSQAEDRAAALRATVRGQRAQLEVAAIEETRAVDRLERIQREAQEWLEELELDGWPGIDGDESGAPSDNVDRQPADLDAVRRRMNALRRELRSIGSINESTLAEFDELRGRHELLTTQTADLERAVAELRAAMDELQTMMRTAFDDAFARVNAAFEEYFARLFGGGHAELVLSDGDDVLESGVDIVARPPGKRLQPLVSLSGGERALTMVALIFALLKTNPAPFCVLDEVDAALDDANVIRFVQMLRELSERTQFIVVSHNRGTMEAAEALYGVTMDTNGVSHVVSLRLSDVPHA